MQKVFDFNEEDFTPFVYPEFCKYSEFGERVICPVDDEGYPIDPMFVDYDRDYGAEWDYKHRYD